MSRSTPSDGISSFPRSPGSCWWQQSSVYKMSPVEQDISGRSEEQRQLPIENCTFPWVELLLGGDVLPGCLLRFRIWAQHVAAQGRNEQEDMIPLGRPFRSLPFFLDQLKAMDFKGHNWPQNPNHSERLPLGFDRCSIAFLRLVPTYWL